MARLKYYDAQNSRWIEGDACADQVMSVGATAPTNPKVGDLWTDTSDNATENSIDFIVEQGVSGNWTYRKWNSGIAECWGTYSLTATSWEAWGSLYQTGNAAIVWYPNNLFNEIPLYTVSISDTAGNAVCGIEIEGAGTKTNTANLRPLRPTSGALGTYTFSIIAKGTWK